MQYFEKLCEIVKASGNEKFAALLSKAANAHKQRYIFSKKEKREIDEAYEDHCFGGRIAFEESIMGPKVLAPPGRAFVAR